MKVFKSSQGDEEATTNQIAALVKEPWEIRFDLPSIGGAVCLGTLVPAGEGSRTVSWENSHAICVHTALQPFEIIFS